MYTGLHRVASTDFVNFLDAFDSFNDLDSKELVIIGDCNVNYLETNDAKTKKLKDMLKITGLRQFINKPTHFGRKDSCLDLILSNSSSIDLSGTYADRVYVSLGTAGTYPGYVPAVPRET